MKPSDMDQTPAEIVDACQTTMAHAWMVRTFVKHSPEAEDFPELMDMLLHQRNDDWIPMIEQMISSDGTEFLLVGALHLVGERGLLAQLRRRGYTVEKFTAPMR